MAIITMKWTGDGLKRFDKAVRDLGSDKAQRAYSMALNKVADKVHTVTKRTVAKQVGVTQATVVKRGAIRLIKAWPGNLTATVEGTGKHMAVKDFAPKQLKKGVKASPWGKRQFYKGTWINVSGKAGGHVFKNTGGDNEKSGRKNAIQALWGPSVPREMVRGASEEAFHRVAATELPIEIDRAIKRVTKGVIG